jgi:Ca-activated chloride channel family protein
MLPNMMAPSFRGNTRDSTILRRAAVFLLLLVCAVAAPDAGLDAKDPGRGQFASSVNLVEVYASVVDAAGQPVRGLTADDFEIAEDGEPQKIAAFAAGDFPLTAALALDRSFSMAGKPLAIVKGAARTFLGALRPSDDAVIIGIGSQVTVLAHARTSRPEQLAAVNELTAWGTTALHDAIVAAIETVDGARGRRALVVLSDGDDRYSDATAADTIARARQSNVMVYPIALGKTRPPLFAELSTVTGGRSFHARDFEGLDQTLTTIAAQLREQYLLGYTPSRAPVNGANEWRSITVRVRKPGVSVRARDGYYVR